MIKKVKNTVPSTYVTEELNGEEIVERVYKNKCVRKIEQKLELKK